MHQHDMERSNSDQSPFSLDLAPNDFFLFGYVKWMIFVTEEEVTEKGKCELQRIKKEVFRKVYDQWILGLKACIESTGDYQR